VDCMEECVVAGSSGSMAHGALDGVTWSALPSEIEL
jgi:hypothetical protein